MRWYKVGSYYFVFGAGTHSFRIEKKRNKWQLLRNYFPVGNYPTLKVAKEVAQFVIDKEKK